MKKLFSLVFFCVFSFLLTASQARTLVAKSVEFTITDSTIPGISSYPMTISYLEAHPDKTPTILFIHGNSASKEFFTSLLEEPALREFRLIAVDLPGHGASSNFPEAVRKYFAAHEEQIFKYNKHYYTYPGFAHTLVKFLTTLNIDPKNLFLVGWSLGAKVAIDMVPEMPQIQKVISIGTPINTFQEAAKGFAELKKKSAGAAFPKNLSILDLLGFREPFTKEQARTFHKLGGVSASDMTETAGVRTDPEARYFVIKFAFGAGDSQDQLGSYQDTQTTVAKYHDKFIILQGSNDPIRLKKEDQERLHTIGVPVHEIAESGHAVFINRPAEVADFIAQHFEVKPSLSCESKTCAAKEKEAKAEKETKQRSALLTISFRKATEDDIPTFVQFAQAIEKDPTDNQSLILVPSHLRAEDFRAAIQKGRFFVAYDQEQRIVAVLKLFLIKTVDELNLIMKYHISNTDSYDSNDIYLYTGTWYVKKEARGQGIIKRLFAHALTSLEKEIDAFAKQHKSKTISLMAGVVPQNDYLITIMENVLSAFVQKYCKKVVASTKKSYTVYKPIFDEKAEEVRVIGEDKTVKASGYILSTAWC